MHAAVIRAADRWRGLAVGEFEQRQLRAIREELNRAHAERTRPAVRQIPSASPVEVIQQGSDLTVPSSSEHFVLDHPLMRI